MPTIEELLTAFPQTGTVTWIGTTSKRRGAIERVERVALLENQGLEGDRHSRRKGRKRQVTLIQSEHLSAVGELLGRSPIDPALTRRNIVVAGINLWPLQTCIFRLGDALLEGTGPCPPCERMEQNLGPGGYLAMRGHGGITARVLEGGTVAIGDVLQYHSGRPDIDGA